MWIKKFVLGGAALPGGLKQAVARARASKDHTTFTVPTKFAVLVAALAGAPTLGVAVGVQGGGWLGLGLWFATSVAFSAFVFLPSYIIKLINFDKVKDLYFPSG